VDWTAFSRPETEVLDLEQPVSTSAIEAVTATARRQDRIVKVM
jgi:hypothetical protein